MTRTDALQELERRRRDAPATRWGRLRRNPWKLVREHTLRRMGRTMETRSATFWGGRFNALLPEDISAMVDRHGYFDLPVCRALLTYVEEGAIVVDIGAHFGFFSLLSSWLVGPKGEVIAVEAMPSTYARLQRNIADNSPHANISAHRTAAYSERTDLTFNDFGPTLSSLNSAFKARGTRAKNCAAAQVNVIAIPMDDLLREHEVQRVDLIKIDAESSESYVLQGLSETISCHRPLVVIEMSDVLAAERAQTDLVLQWARAHDYVPHRWRDGAFRPYADGPIGYDNFVLIPRERTDPTDG